MPSMTTFPSVGLSMQPIMFSNVVFPEPEGPMNAYEIAFVYLNVNVV